MPKVLNKYKDEIPKGAVYIGRPSIYGNPYPINKNQDRTKVIQLFAQYLEERPDLKARVRKDLRGKDLVCFCAPLACHGDVLLKVANEPDLESS